MNVPPRRSSVDWWTMAHVQSQSCEKFAECLWRWSMVWRCVASCDERSRNSVYLVERCGEVASFKGSYVA